MRSIFLIIVLLTLSVAGCTENESQIDPPDISTARLPIINGVPPDSPRHEAVVAILIAKSDGNYICSGSLISPNVVVTAAHCTDVQLPRRPKFVVADPSQLGVYLSDDLLEGPYQGYGVEEVVIHDGYNRRYLGLNDISLIRLSQPVPACTEGLAFPYCADPVPALPTTDGLGFSNADIGVADNLDFAGFGVTTLDSGAGVKMHVEGTLGGFGCAVPGCSASGDPDTQISYSQDYNNPDPDGVDGQGACFGDSGGPAFIQRNGEWYTAGVTSYGDSTCSVFGVSMRVDAYQDFIRGFVLNGGCETAADCDDASECTVDSCDLGICSNTPVADDTACSAGICCAGVCGTPACELDADCDDGDTCTDDLCSAGGTCAASCASSWPDCGLEDGCCGADCTDLNDPDCTTCLGNKAACTDNADCCSGVCKGGKCRGN